LGQKEAHLNQIALVLRIALCFSALGASSAFAQTAAPVPQAPVPPALHAANTIFISNAGAESGLFPSPFSGDPNRGYNQLYAALKTDGRFQLVDKPADADLVLELQLTAPNGPTNGSKVNGASNPVPMLRLVIYDRQTHYILWALTQSIEIAFRQKTHDHNFDDALASLVQEFETLCGNTQATAHGS
jgi:hypothetical protein